MIAECATPNERIAAVPQGVPAVPFDFDRALQRSVARAALACLAAASLVGVLLAVLLLWPDAGALLGALSYGRWMPVHLDVQLFGWCSLPVVGVLMHRILPTTPRWHLAARVALAAWLAALAAGSVDWILGYSSGKLFLDWSGADRLALIGAQGLLWLVLAGGWWARRGTAGPHLVGRVGDAAMLLLLASVPVALGLSARPEVYPPVNPDSGGATGHSLLASSLGVVGIALVLPALLGRPARRRILQETLTIAAIFAANWGVYAYIGHGNATNHDGEQIAGLGTLLLWPGLLVWWFRLYSWERHQRRWLVTTALWCALLVADGFILFLPGVLDSLKFTNALVAHSHLAMAGLLTALNMLLLVSLDPDSPLARALDRPGDWLAWNGGCLAMVVVLTAVGLHEAGSPLAPWDGDAVVTAGYAARLLAGLVMTVPALRWMAASLRSPAATAHSTLDRHAP